MTSRIGLSQRVAVVDEYQERRDCLDQRWALLIQSLGGTPVPLLNGVDDVGSYLEDLALSGLVLTGGSDLSGYGDEDTHAPERERFEREALEFALRQRIPVFGVCRGLQLINDYFGGDLIQVEGHEAEPHPVTVDSQGPLRHESDAVVNSYHQFAIDNDTLAGSLIPLGRADDDTVEYARHDLLPVQGVMWHPERRSPADSIGRQILSASLEVGESR